MVAAHSGIGVIAGAILFKTVSFTDGGVKIDGEGVLTGTATGIPGARQQFPA